MCACVFASVCESASVGACACVGVCVSECVGVNAYVVHLRRYVCVYVRVLVPV